MAILKIKIETCSGGLIEEVLQQMIDIAELTKCEVEGDLNGTKMVVGPKRIDDVMQLWNLKREQ